MIWPTWRHFLVLTMCAGMYLFVCNYTSSYNVLRTYIHELKIVRTNIEKKNFRDQCCVTSNNLQSRDICGRKNCTSVCPDPVSSIPELDNNQTAFEKAFFLETTGNNKLDFRQACSVESLALLNPSLKVYVLFTGKELNNTDTILHALREKYKNLNLVRIDLADYVAGTRLEKWYHCTDWRKGPYHVAHLSEGLRLLSLAKYGGYYFDLDLIHLRPITEFRNFTCTEDGVKASNKVIHASYGHPFMQFAITHFARNPRPDNVSFNGLDLLTKVLQRWCGVDKIASMNLDNCQGIQILPQQSFYPVNSSSWNEYFIENNATRQNKTPVWLTKEVIAVDVWNQLSAKEAIRKKSTQLYARLAKKACPVTISIAPDIF